MRSIQSQTVRMHHLMEQKMARILKISEIERSSLACIRFGSGDYQHPSQRNSMRVMCRIQRFNHLSSMLLAEKKVLQQLT